MKKSYTFGLVILGLIIFYCVGFWRSIKNVDDFCGSINSETNFADLRKIAAEAGVTLRGPFKISSNADSVVFAEAASFFTMGEYACSVKARDINSNIQSKRLGYMSTGETTNLVRDHK